MFENQLGPILTEAVGRVLNDYIARPYNAVWEDYVEKSQMEAQLFNERVDTIIKATD